MVDIAAIAGVASSLKAASDITKSVVGLRDAEVIRSKVIDLQGEILSAQSSAIAAQADQFALTERIRELEKEVAASKTWNAEKARYELIDLYRGIFAYVLKEAEQGREAAHALCANCFQRGFKSILQTNGEANVHQRTWVCTSCKFTAKNQWADMKALIKKSREYNVEAAAP